MSAPTGEGLTCSVVVPVRDDEAQLAGLLTCLARQSEAPLEVVVVDNGSSDGSAALARAHGCRVVVEPVVGIPAAAAAGYDAALGDVIVRCDADSRPPPDWLAAHRRAHASCGPDVVAVTGPGRFDLPRPWDALASGAYVGAYALASRAALGHWPLFGTTMSFRTAWWRRVRDRAARTADVHDDMDLSFRVAPGERVQWRRDVGVGMSRRALSAAHAPGARVRRAIATLRRAWTQEPPWERHRRRRARARA